MRRERERGVRVKVLGAVARKVGAGRSGGRRRGRREEAARLGWRGRDGPTPRGPGGVKKRENGKGRRGLGWAVGRKGKRAARLGFLGFNNFSKGFEFNLV